MGLETNVSFSLVRLSLPLTETEFTFITACLSAGARQEVNFRHIVHHFSISPFFANRRIFLLFGFMHDPQKLLIFLPFIYFRAIEEISVQTKKKRAAAPSPPGQ